MEVALTMGVPTIVVPGATSILVTSTEDGQSPKFDGRKKYKHNPEITLIALSVEEMRIVAKTFAEKLNKSIGKVKFLFPKKGSASQDKEGLSLWNPDGNKAFLEELKANLRKDIELIEIDAHINDEEFANIALEQLIEVIGNQN